MTTPFKAPAALALAWFAAALPAAAQVVTAPQGDVAAVRQELRATMAPPHRAMPKDVAALDGWLAARDNTSLAHRLGAADAPGLALDMNWEQTRLYDGAGLIVALAYVHSLWQVAEAADPGDAKGFRDSAAVYALYALNMVTLDGARCADDSAPQTRFGQVADQVQPMMAYLRGLSRADRMNIGSLALQIEAATSQKRGDDQMICSGGLDQYQHDQEAGAGSTYAPVFLSPEIWWPAQDKLRQALPAELTIFLG